MNVSEELRQFDGKRIGPLEAVATQLLTCEGSVDELLTLSHRGDGKMQTAATWVLKWLGERHVRLSKSQTQEVIRLLRSVTHWEARLHLLQLINGLEIPPRNGTSLHRILKENLNDDNKLIRAWSYNGLFVLGEQISSFRNQVGELLNKAQHDPAASVRARVRQIGKASSWANRCLTTEKLTSRHH